MYALLPREERDAMREHRMEERRRLAAKLDNEFTADPTCPSPRASGRGHPPSAPAAGPGSAPGCGAASRHRFCHEHR